MLLIPQTTPEAEALQAAVRRGRVRRLSRGVYTDDLDTPAERIIEQGLLVILGTRFPDWYVSHSTAALLRPYRGQAFVSGSGARRPLELPGVRLHRLPALRAPETRILELEETVASSLSSDPQPARVRVSSPLQTVFEVLSADARQPDRTLPEENIRGLMEGLSATDRARAERFAARNDLSSQYAQFEALAQDLEAAGRVPVGRSSSLDLFFYDWRVGRLEELSGREYRFTYDSEWRTPLTPHLPVPGEGPAYEGPGLPSFLENLLPEGWAEARLRAVHRIAGDDAFGLLRTTPKYLSNLTLRPEDFDASMLAFDRVETRLRDLAPDASERVAAVEELGEAPDTRELWQELRRRGALRLSGVQAKLPVRLETRGAKARLELAAVGQSGAHILKFHGQDDPQLVQNEWATMELARRVGLPVAEVRQVEFQRGSSFRSPALLIERFDVPATDEPAEITLLEDAASLMGLERDAKYRTSMERVQDALAAAGLGDSDFVRFFEQCAFSWLVGNGDLHAKNVSILRVFRPGRLGSVPEPIGVRLSPAYDLLNTAIVIHGDLFALPVNGRENHLRPRDFLVLADRWGLPGNTALEKLKELAAGLRVHLEPVLAASGLTDARIADYRAVVESRVAGFE